MSEKSRDVWKQATQCASVTHNLTHIFIIIIQSNLGSRTPRIMNNSVYKQIFRTQSVSDDVLCLELRTRKPSTLWSDKLGVSASAVFVDKTNHNGQLFSETEAQWV